MAAAAPLKGTIPKLMIALLTWTTMKKTGDRDRVSHSQEPGKINLSYLNLERYFPFTDKTPNRRLRCRIYFVSSVTVIYSHYRLKRRIV